ncbi:MAG TPA: TAXI family TRAP transporter solute-binding subunit [Hyphomicrobiaceae bacterium]|jgi:TRAP transporter TAXI family solute receptor|nr:TAXI family TRAP transporter solute-binding subunit [Hyphomicrobiaceae bacterium]
MGLASISRRLWAAVLLAHAFALPAAAQKSTITFGSTNATSSNYALAVAMSKAIKKELPNTNVSMIETGASVDNVRRLTKGEIDFGLVMADTSIQALGGTGPFQGKAVDDLAVLYVHDIVTLQLVVRADAGVATLKDLQGKKFSAGIRGSGAELLTRQMFQLMGIEPQWSPGSIQDAVEGTQNRQLVGYSKYGVGSGLDATLRELMVSTQMRYLTFDKEQQAAILAKIKGVDFAEIPANTIPGQAAVTTPVVLGTYSARVSTMDDATAFSIAKAINENRQFLVDVFPHLKDMNFKEQALKTETLGLKLHPGAKKYWLSVQ